MAIIRTVVPELLDSLPPEDAGARRSRRDLRLINALMGNTTWFARALARFRGRAGDDIVEIGAGEGRLSRALKEKFPIASITGIDRAPRPDDLPSKIGWKQGDLFEVLPETPAGVLVGCMIVHHFDDEMLQDLGEVLGSVRMLCLCEPLRTSGAHFLGTLMRPLVGGVTWHDMHVSIDAGFLPGELPRLLQLQAWQVEESVDWRGSLRLLAWR